MIKKLLFLLILLMTVATNTWAESYRLYLDVSGTSATLKYGSDFSGKPSYSSGTWSDIGDVKILLLFAVFTGKLERKCTVNDSKNNRLAGVEITNGCGLTCTGLTAD